MTTPIPAGWKPIISAPKDGTPVLAFWTGATEAATVYGRSYGITMFKHGEWVNVDNCDDNYSEPTHWMPLPAAPGSPASVTPGDALDEPIALDRLADYIADNWPDKKYGLEEICQRLNATWPGAFMPAAPAAGDALDAARYRWLRDHACNSLHLTRDGDHACNYLTAAQWIESCPEDFQDDAPEEIERMKATNTIWRLQVYPSTPIGFWVLHASTLDAAIDAALAAQVPQQGEA